MKKWSRLILAGVVSLTLIHVPAASEAATKAKAFKNCTEMQKTYKGGVAKKAGLKNRTGYDKNGKPIYKATKYKAYVSLATYNLNTKSDRDKDGIACER
ncbi:MULTISPECIES: excalibur calcium-binding domain-containing protein [unclassified Exiguobacterium]|uniref:excalibur calcium-binding domain-containing protein n=1 Tax=unclassified Exiguobacterium TaxID=2644629 RepID=UPI000E8E87FE|nr:MULTISPECIES: excalibur calcium-binding domain-containing protein [unclassified Exiguobacterium]HAZ40193.1 calcium-binding protein [Exiguobacterium sp.]